MHILSAAEVEASGAWERALTLYGSGLQGAMVSGDASPVEFVLSRMRMCFAKLGNWSSMTEW